MAAPDREFDRGSIHRNFDLMLEHEIPIVRRARVAVVHHLLHCPASRWAR